MPRPEQIPLPVPQSVATGAFRDVHRFRDKFVQIGGTFVATLQLQGTIDGSEFFNIGGPVSSPTVIPVPETVQFLQVDVTAFTSGAPTATAAGFDFRAI